MKLLTAILAVMTILAVPGFALAEDIVGRFLGVWVGEGMVRPRGFDQAEKIRCKVKGERMSDFQISFAGRCATTSGATGFRMVIAQDNNGRAFAAKINLVSGTGDVAFSGSAKADLITLKQVKPLTQAERILISEITLDLSPGKEIGMKNTVKDLNSGEQAKSLEILFVRQN